jgi:hypothetical protein
VVAVSLIGGVPCSWFLRRARRRPQARSEAKSFPPTAGERVSIEAQALGHEHQGLDRHFVCPGIEHPVIAVDLVETSTAVMSHKRGNDLLVRAPPGRHHYGRITIRRAYTDDNAFWQWRRTVSDGKLERKAGSIILLDGEAREVTRFNFFEA